ncbi:MAG: Flp family type IVb pilin [Phenylobacterium sp.]|jgi:pilus assembly protein Flp/PilA|uniref:Flp family type IVb pilin n=1 Tax=Phenylobacterium sp. TaxID=1871053 RepID=UPI003918ACF0
MKTFLDRFMRDQTGATAVEYALICALISIVLISAYSALTPKIAAVFEKVGNAVPQSDG